ncbi:MAG TPA: DUF2304 family protein [Candidatus Limnocylindrales bacterium]|nr:DUF2304 family protein [Candidatus Limnocylindrales bacterium]
MPSLLRIVGVVVAVGIVALVIVVARRGSARTIIVPLLLIGVGLLAISVVPDIVRPVQDFIGLGDQPVGRIITVLVFSVMVAYLLIFLVFAKAERQTQRIRRLIRALSAAQLEQSQMGDHAGGILVVIPAYNEAESLPGVLAEVPATVSGRPTRVLVVDDASRDMTRRVALERGAHVVTHPVNGGQGSALQTGYLVAERLGVEVVVTLDADGQHVPAEMERLVGPILAGEADFVVGSRRSGTYEREAGADSMARNVGIGIFTRLINLLGGTNITDVANGYRAIRASRLAEIVFTEDQFHNPELLLGAARAGLRIREVPVTIRVRSAGTSKKGGTFRYGYGFLRVILRSWLR